MRAQSVSPYDIVMLVLNDVCYDRRVRQEAAALVEAGWRVLVIGTQRFDGQQPDFETLQGFDLLRVRYGRYGAQKWWPWRWIRHSVQAWSVIRTVGHYPTRAYHAHDLPALVLLSAVRALRRKRAALVYDAHELFLFMSPRSRLYNGWQRLTRPLFMRLEGFLVRRADAVVTVTETRARLMARWYGIPRPRVILTAIHLPDEHTPAPVDLRALVGDRWCIVHTGRITLAGRCLEELIRAFACLPDNTALVFLGPPEGAEAGLQRLAENLGVGERLFWLPPVPPEDVAAVIQQADAAAVLMRSNSFNERTSCPVKWLEALAAGLPVVASNQFPLVQMIRRFDLGAICDPTSPASIAEAFRNVLSPGKNAAYREQVLAAREQVIRWTASVAAWRAIYRQVLDE